MNPHWHHARVFAVQACKRPVRALVAAALLAMIGAGFDRFAGWRSLPAEARTETAWGPVLIVGPLAVLVLLALLAFLGLLADLSNVRSGGKQPMMETLPLEPRRRALAEAGGAVVVWAGVLVIGLAVLRGAAMVLGGASAVEGAPGWGLLRSLLVVPPGLFMMRLGMLNPKQTRLERALAHTNDVFRHPLAPEPLREPWHARARALYRDAARVQAVVVLTGLVVAVLCATLVPTPLSPDGVDGTEQPSRSWPWMIVAYSVLFASVLPTISLLRCDVATTLGRVGFSGAARDAWSVFPVAPHSVRRAALRKGAVGLLPLWALVAVCAVPFVGDRVPISVMFLAVFAAFLSLNMPMPIAGAYGDRQTRRLALGLFASLPMTLLLAARLQASVPGAAGQVLAWSCVAVPVLGIGLLVRRLVRPLADEVGGR